jgi:hypothetical protein
VIGYLHTTITPRSNNEFPIDYCRPQFGTVLRHQ